MSINSYFPEKCSLFQAHALYGSDGLTDEGKKARCIMIAKAVGGAALIALGLAIIGTLGTFLIKYLITANVPLHTKIILGIFPGAMMIIPLGMIAISVGGYFIASSFEPVAEEKRSVYFQIPSTVKQAAARPLPGYLSLDSK